MNSTPCGSPSGNRKPLDVKYDQANDLLTIEGITYAGLIFRSFATLDVGTWLRIEAREDGVLTMRRAPPGSFVVEEVAGQAMTPALALDHELTAMRALLQSEWFKRVTYKRQLQDVIQQRDDLLEQLRGAAPYVNGDSRRWRLAKWLDERYAAQSTPVRSRGNGKASTTLSGGKDHGQGS